MYNFFCLFLFVYIFVYIFLPDAGGNTNDPDFEMEETANDIREESKPEAKPKPKADTETQCYYCGQMFLVSQIKEHMSNTHGSYFGRMHGAPRPFQCHNCNGTFKTQSALGEKYQKFMSYFVTFMSYFVTFMSHKCHKCVRIVTQYSKVQNS